MKIIIYISVFLVVVTYSYSIPPGTTVYIYSPLGRQIEAEVWGRSYLKESECHRYDLTGYPSAKYEYNESGTDCMENYACYGYSWFVSEGSNHGLDWIDNCMQAGDDGCEDCYKLVHITDFSALEKYKLFVEYYDDDESINDIDNDSYMMVYPPGNENHNEAYWDLREKIIDIELEHAGIIFESDDDYTKDLCISKWAQDPLIRHKRDENEWWRYSVDFLYFQKRYRKADGYSGDNNLNHSSFSNNHKNPKNWGIGEHLESSGVIESLDPEDNPNRVNFYVGKLKNSRISLKNGFHAKSGCNFHSFTKGKPEGSIFFPKISVPDVEVHKPITSNEFRLMVYPNPGSNFINLCIRSNLTDKDIIASYYVYNILGELENSYTASINNHISVDVGNLLEGIYFIKAMIYSNSKYENKTIFSKLIISR